MLLRHFIQHFRKQEWTAIGLDFLIVVAGVFIGIQVSNWNAARADAREYALAQHRLMTELGANLATLDGVADQLGDRLEKAGTGLDLLLACAPDTEANRVAVSEGIMAISGTIGIVLRTSALYQITDDPRLLARQSEDERAFYSTLRHNIDLLLTEAKYAEDLPLAERVANNPVIAIGPTYTFHSTMEGTPLSEDFRSLVLAGSMEEACRDDPLKKSFFDWERWQTRELKLSSMLRGRMEQALKRGSEE